jgi:hypothetical protein
VIDDSRRTPFVTTGGAPPLVMDCFRRRRAASTAYANPAASNTTAITMTIVIVMDCPLPLLPPPPTPVLDGVGAAVGPRVVVVMLTACGALVPPTPALDGVGAAVGGRVVAPTACGALVDVADVDGPLVVGGRFNSNVGADVGVTNVATGALVTGAVVGD